MRLNLGMRLSLVGGASFFLYGEGRSCIGCVTRSVSSCMDCQTSVGLSGPSRPNEISLAELVASFEGGFVDCRSGSI